MSAAAIRTGSLDSEVWKACALPWKPVMTVGRHAHVVRGLLDGCHRVAERHAGLRLNDSVAAGNCD